MFTAKQTKLMNVLGIVSDADRFNFYESYCEVAFEMRANGMDPASFTSWIEHKIRFAELVAKKNNEKAIKQLIG